MNFKTTIFLAILVIIAGGIAMFTGNTNKYGSESDQSQVVLGGEKLLDATAEQANLVMIIDADGNRAGAQKVDGRWHITEPISSIGEEPAIMRLLNTILEIHSQGRPSGLGGVDTGLDKPKYRIEVALDDGRDLHLVLGNKTNLGDQMYASVDNGEVNLIDPAVVKKLTSATDDLRNKHLMAIKPSEVRQFRLTWGGKTISGSKFFGKWLIQQPNGVVIDGDEKAIATFLGSINLVEATEFVKPNDPALQLARFDRPLIQIWATAVAETDQAFPTTAPSTRPASTQPNFRRDEVMLTIGGPDDLSRQRYFVETSDGIFAKVPANALDKYRITASDLRDRKIVSIKPDEVQSISIQKQIYQTEQPTTRGGPIATPMVVVSQQITLTRRAQGTVAATRPTTMATTMPASWQLADDPNAKVDNQKVMALLNQLHPLRAENFLEKHPVSPTSRFYVVQIRRSSGAPEQLDVTKPANDDKPFAIYNGLLFEVSPDLTEALDADFRDNAR